MNKLRRRKFFNLFRKSFLGNSHDTIALAHLLGGKLLTVKNVGQSWSNAQKNSTSRTYASFSFAWDLYRNHFKIVCYLYHSYHRLDVGTMLPPLCRKFIFAHAFAEFSRADVKQSWSFRNIARLFGKDGRACRQPFWTRLEAHSFLEGENWKLEFTTRYTVETWDNMKKHGIHSLKSSAASHHIARQVFFTQQKISARQCLLYEFQNISKSPAWLINGPSGLDTQ